MTDDLISRLEQATEGSRELDAEVWVATAQSDESYIKRTMAISVVAAGGDPIDLPHYTTSLDDAMMLMPEGLSIEITGFEDGEWWVDVGGPYNVGQPFERSGARPTAALALCIAILKALMAA